MTKRTKQKDDGILSPEQVKTMFMQLKAPEHWFKALDEWRERQDFKPKPSRPASIRWIVWTFLQKQQQTARTARRRSK